MVVRLGMTPAKPETTATSCAAIHSAEAASRSVLRGQDFPEGAACEYWRRIARVPCPKVGTMTVWQHSVAQPTRAALQLAQELSNPLTVARRTTAGEPARALSRYAAQGGSASSIAPGIVLPAQSPPRQRQREDEDHSMHIEQRVRSIAAFLFLARIHRQLHANRYS